METRFDRFLVRQLLETMRLRQLEAPTPERAATIDELVAAVESNDELIPLPDVVEAVERSSLGAVAARAYRRCASASTVADVLGRADRLAALGNGGGGDEVDTEPIDGPIVDWVRELTRLRTDSGLDQEKLLVELESMGLLLTHERLDAMLTGPPVVPDREIVRSIVTVLGGDWTGQGYEACYDAALDEQRRLDGRLGAAAGRQDVSGLEGADPLTARTLRQQAQAEFDLLPAEIHGREEVVDQLCALLGMSSAAPRVLVGEAGAGKSTVALAVADAAQQSGVRTWWVRAHDRNQVARGMLAIATQLNAPVTELNALQADLAQGAELLWRRLDASAARWLLVFDGADEPDVLTVDADEPTGWIRPSPAGTVLVTSRRREPQAWVAPAVLVAIDDLPPAAGARILLDGGRTRGALHRSTAPDTADVRAASEVSERLGGVALALRILGAHLRSTYTTPIDVAAVLPASRDRSDRITTAWQFVIESLVSRGLPEAKTLLRVVALYAPSWVVPLEVISPRRLASCELAAERHDDFEQHRPWHRALAGLRDAGLLTYRLTAGEQVAGVLIHPLVAELTRASGPDPDAEAAAVDLMLQATAGLDAGRPANWAALRRLEPHVHALLDNLESTPPWVGAAALMLATRVAEGLIRAGLYALGEALIRHGQSRAVGLPPHAPEQIAAEHTLAWALGLRGEFAASEKRLRRLVRELRRIGQFDCSQSLKVRDHLAWVIAEQGRLAEAKRRYRVLLPSCERVLGDQDRRTVAVRHRMAWITALKGRPAEAERQFAELLPQRCAALGPDHMEVLSSRYRLAWARALQGRYEDAERDFLELLADVGRLFDPDSAPVIMVRARLGWIRTWLGRFTDAEADCQLVHEVRSRVLGAQHTRTLRARQDLAWTLSCKGDYRAAERILREVLAVVERAPELGRDHPLALEARGRLTYLLLGSGRLAEAERRTRALVNHRNRVLGAEHPGTLDARSLLGRVLVAWGRLPGAQRELNRVLSDQERLLGRHHRAVLETRAALADVIARRGQLTVAQKEIEDVLELRRVALGPRHRHSLASREQLVWILGERERLVEAEAECLSLIRDRAAVLGTMHPDTLSARYRLAWLTALAERGSEAALLYQELIVDQHRVLGREHPNTMRTRHGFARELLRSGAYDEGEQALRNVLIDRIPLLGRRHPDTLANRHDLAFALALRGCLAEAEASMLSVLRDQMTALGPDHRTTLASRERLGWIRATQHNLDRPENYWLQLLDDRLTVLEVNHPDTRRIRARLASPNYEVGHWW